VRESLSPPHVARLGGAPSGASSESSSWQEIVRDGGSSDDLTDLDDVSCVSLAPRRPIRTCSVHLPPLKMAPFQRGGRDHGDAPSAPPASAVMMLRRELEPDEGDGVHSVLRMRRNLSVPRVGDGDPGEEGVRGDEEMRAAVTAGVAGMAGECLAGTGVVDGRTLCDVNVDGNMLWTFLAGMLLHVATV
jgi:hypothetical protein